MPLPGESLTSLLRRAAQAMEYRGARQIQDLLAITDTSPIRPGLPPPGPQMECLAALLRCDIERLAAMTVQHFAGSLVLLPHGSAPPAACDRTTIARYFVKGAHPVCPACLAQDTEPYERLLWRFQSHWPSASPMAACSCGNARSAGRALRRDRLAADRCPCGAASGMRLPVLSEAMVNHLRSLSQWLPADRRFRIYRWRPVLTWADQLVRAIVKTQTWLESLANEWHVPTGTPPEILGWAGAADILTHWPERFYEFLKALQDGAETQAGMRPARPCVLVSSP